VAAVAHGLLGRRDVERDWNPDVTGQAVRSRLEAIRGGRRLDAGA
jgi:hypothetical protein